MSPYLTWKTNFIISQNFYFFNTSFKYYFFIIFYSFFILLLSPCLSLLCLSVSQLITATSKPTKQKTHTESKPTKQNTHTHTANPHLNPPLPIRPPSKTHTQRKSTATTANQPPSIANQHPQKSESTTTIPINHHQSPTTTGTELCLDQGGQWPPLAQWEKGKYIIYKTCFLIFMLYFCSILSYFRKKNTFFIQIFIKFWFFCGYLSGF